MALRRLNLLQGKRKLLRHLKWSWRSILCILAPLTRQSRLIFFETHRHPHPHPDVGVGGEAEVRRVIERWAQVDEAEAEEAEREVRRAVEKAREEEESKKE